jgi:hypothetical protein
MLNDFFADSWLGNPTHSLPWGLVTMIEDLRRSPKLVLEHVNKTVVGVNKQETDGVMFPAKSLYV